MEMVCTVLTVSCELRVPTKVCLLSLWEFIIPDLHSQADLAKTMW